MNEKMNEGTHLFAFLLRNPQNCIVMSSRGHSQEKSMTIARKEIVAGNEERNYHCTTRCVRRAFLCGFDAYSGRDFEHRRQWIKDRLMLLSSTFGLEVLGYSVMSNHLHIILRTRPDVTALWPDHEVARRWLVLHPPQTPIGITPQVLSEDDIARITSNPERISILRHRLGNISWFMSHLDEPIARQANKEDGCKGRFWEGRFKCQRLLDDAALLACMVYVDLNPIRAGLAMTPEESQFTSAFDRIKARQATVQVQVLESASDLLSKDQAGELVELKKEAACAKWLCPIGGNGESHAAFTRLTLDEYLEVLNATGKVLLSNKQGAIPEGVAPILERLFVKTSCWLDTVCGYESLFRRVVGRLETLVAAAHNAERHWFQGFTACRNAFS